NRKIYIIIILRLLLLIINCFAIVYFIYFTGYIYTIIGLAFMIVLQSWLFIRLFNRTNKYISKFIIQLKENEISSVFSQKNIESYYPGLKDYLNEINNLISNIRIDKENQYLYLQYLVEHIGIGLIAFNDSGKVDLINSTAKDILNIPGLHNIKSLDMIREGFSYDLTEMKPDQQKIFIIKINNELLHLSVKVSVLILKNKNIRLYSFQNINNELDEKELESWQKLISVLTHEIMNSVTPITMVTSTISDFFKKNEKVKPVAEINNEIIKETLKGLEMIEDRGKGLIKFVNHYKELSKLPDPEFQTIVISELFNNINVLMKDKISSSNIKVKFIIEPENLKITVDPAQIQQILINLIKNSIEAIENKKSGSIQINAYLENERTVIQVADNGIGITEDLMDKIFIPFFTTKEKGSGVGLSLSRQIMRLHGGNLSVKSDSENNTIFQLKF
ncbi:PAS domain-containing sensor histidine kinase, partial [Bacteroidota bacterium]